MTKAKSVSTKRTSGLVRMLPGLVITIIALAALYYFVDLDALRSAFALADYRWLPLVILIFFGTLAARAMAWRTILKERASFKESFVVINQAYLLNNVLPFRLGELGRALILSGRVKMSFWHVFSTIVVERVFDLGIAAGLLLSTLPLVVGADWARPAASVAIAIVLLGFVVLFLMASNPKRVSKLIAGVTKPWPRLQNWVTDKLAAFLEGLSALRDGRRFARVAFWMLLTWLLNIAWYFALMRSFLPEAIWLWAVFGVAVTSFGVALPSSPAYIGVLETALVGALSLFGVDPSVALAYAVVAHVIYFVITGLIGIFGFWQQGESLGGVYQKLLARPAAK